VSADTACCASTLAARSRSSDMFGRPVSEFTSCLQSTQLQCADVTHQLAQDVVASRASDRLTSSQLSVSATCESGAWMSINAANTAGFLVCVQWSVCRVCSSRLATPSGGLRTSTLSCVRLHGLREYVCCDVDSSGTHAYSDVDVLSPGGVVCQEKQAKQRRVQCIPQYC
jgi:hypothetical protein